MKKVLVLGASGNMGSAIVQECCERGFWVKAFARNKERLEQLFKENSHVEVLQGDVFNLTDLHNAAEDVDLIVHAVNIPYQEWGKLPILMENVIQTVKKRKVKFAYVDNIYAYGRSVGKMMTEDMPKNPHTKKGKIRLQLQNMIKESGIEYIIAYFPDFYGPYAKNTTLNTTTDAVKNNKKAVFLGNPKLAREYIYLPDGAKTFVNLVLHEKAYGQEWNIPSYGAITGDEIIEIIREITSYDKKITIVTKRMVQMLGLFNPFMREFAEMFYLVDEPVVLSGEKYEREIGPLPRTSYYDGLKEIFQIN
ncbi:MAG: SDR family NAD(P)-dependent oxidoreductase [Lysinibacillus sp.]|nr:SDR family NAD(P)-dependent oxidoreductase [Lysinibacillus sp.]